MPRRADWSRIVIFGARPVSDEPSSLGDHMMKIQMRKLCDIKPYENNPRKNDAAVDAVAASIKEFGFQQPLVIDAEGVIIVGHTRFLAALKLGLDEVPVVVATKLSPQQVRA